MADQSYEIDIEPGREDDEMQIDNDTNIVKRRGRGFGSNTGDVQLSVRNEKTGGPGNPAHATAVRCMLPIYLREYA